MSSVGDACDHPPPDPEPLQQTLLIVLTASNMALLFLVGLLVRRLESLHAKLTRYLKRGLSKSSSGSLVPRASSDPPSPSPDVTRDLVKGHVHILQKTLSNESLRSSLSADDFASLHCMLGDEDGVTM